MLQENEKNSNSPSIGFMSVSPFVSTPHLELSVFSGPFDLLYQLMQKGEIGWNELILKEVAMEFDNFEEVDDKSAFLTHFVHLAWLKASSYFPEAPIENVENEKPLSILEIIASYQVARLLRTNLEEQESLSSLIHRRAPLPALPTEKGLEGVAIQELEKLFKTLLEKQSFKFQLPVEIEVSIMEILELLLEKLHIPLPFENIFCQNERKDWIPNFLAILEGIKQEKIELLSNGYLCRKAVSQT